MFKPEGHDYVAGRDDSWVEPGDPAGKFIDNILPAGHTTAVNHDKLVGALVRSGVPDPLANYPTMLPTYVFSLGQELANGFGAAFNFLIGRGFNAPFPHSDPLGPPRRLGAGGI